VHTGTVSETAAARLGEVLRSLEYSEESVTEMLGEEAYGAAPEEVPALARRLDPGKLGTATDLLFLARAVPQRDAVRALGRRGVAALEATGLAEVAGGEVIPRARVVPVDDLLIAGDSFSKGLDDPPDYVASFSPTSRVCAALTPRHHVDSALDVGTGSGAQALFAAQHARRVVATDVNERALEFTRLNAHLNGLTNIECRRGTLFEPVGDEQFDLVTCNAPYVVSPEQRWMYRDGGHMGDELSALIVRGAAARLADGGFATLNVSWLADDEDEPDERIVEWIDTRSCEAWVLVAWEADPLEHAADWTAEHSHDVAALGHALDEWTRYFDALGARWVSEGTVVLRRRGGRGRTIRIDPIDPDSVGDAADQIERAFAARERLSWLDSREDLLDLRVAVAAPLRLEEELDGRGRPRGAVVALAEGTESEVETTPEALELVAALDGSRPLRDVVGGAARRDVLKLVRELLELGALTIEEPD
jgi:methylase of polypeptide subunit release factors